MTKTKNDTPPIDLRALYGQGKWWWSAGQSAWMRVKDMHPAHRQNAAAMLVREATNRAARLGAAELALYRSAPDEVWAKWERVLEERNADPVAWMKGTKLYRSLMKFQSAIDRLSSLPEIKIARGGVTWPMPSAEPQPQVELDVIERAKPFLALCGACDVGLPMSCTCPPGDVRMILLEFIEEIERLRAGRSEL